MKIADIFVKLKENICLLYKKNKKLFLAAVACLAMILAGVILPILKSSQSANNEEVKSINYSSYVDMLESKIKNILLNISQIETVDVLIVADSTEKKVFLTQTETTTSKNDNNENVVVKEEIVYDKNGSSQSPVLVTTVYPKVLSVLISINKVDSSTKISLQNAVSGVLNIDTSCIFILQDR